MKTKNKNKNIIIKSDVGNRFEITSRYLYQLSRLGKRFRRVRLKDLHIALGYSNGWFVTGQERVWHLGWRMWEDIEWRAKYYPELPRNVVTIGCMYFEGRSASRILNAAKGKRKTDAN